MCVATCRGYSAFTVHNDVAVVVGGYNDLTVFSDVWVLRVGSSRWDQLVSTGSNSLLLRQSPRLASMGGVMWLMGGVPAQVCARPVCACLVAGEWVVCGRDG